jgi:uncharacterized protein YjeT (DUF2065 family)
MENASKIMYKIANVFNWIEVACGILLVICGIVLIVNPNAVQSSNTAAEIVAGGTGSLIGGIYLIIFSVVLIILTRIAYKQGSSKGWDILFIVLGAFGSIFYLLGGIFGLVAKTE